MEYPIEFYGRAFTAGDIETIRWTIREYPGLSFAETAGTVCEMLGWNTPAGNAKTWQCLRLLDKLAAEGEIAPPEKRKAGKRAKGGKARRKEPEAACLPEDPGVEVTACGEIELAAVGRTELAQWRRILTEYHPIGGQQMYGAQLRYYIKSGGQVLGCLQFSAAAWALECRDEWIGWSPGDRKARLHLIANNSRFLLLPWVRVRNLASRALSMAAGRLQGDWLAEYCYAPVLLETFVDTSQHSGTCYKASNWAHIGDTKGRGRYDTHGERLKTVKAVYALPLEKGFRAVLKGEKPWKAVGEDER